MAKQDMDMSVDEMLDSAGSDPRVYELGFHLDPELPTEEAKNAYQAIRELVASKGTIVAEGEPQKVQLSYTISRQETSGRRDFDSAYFAWVVYESVAESHADILASASADKRIIRFIDLITTKDAARHSAEMRELSMKTAERAEDAKEVAGAELDAALENVVV
ncbi:30S ribosomal protein S6 [Candidatus Kaiserbacteria bacterium]|nr:30S ribosomal protein S6 [Candidatus Kaiserbacteria bacterium]